MMAVCRIKQKKYLLTILFFMAILSSSAIFATKENYRNNQNFVDELWHRSAAANIGISNNNTTQECQPKGEDDDKRLLIISSSKGKQKMKLEQPKEEWEEEDEKPSLSSVPIAAGRWHYPPVKIEGPSKKQAEMEEEPSSLSVSIAAGRWHYPPVKIEGPPMKKEDAKKSSLSTSIAAGHWQYSHAILEQKKETEEEKEDDLLVVYDEGSSGDVDHSRKTDDSDQQLMKRGKMIGKRIAAAAKNGEKYDDAYKEKVVKLTKELKKKVPRINYAQIAEAFGVSRNSLERWRKVYNNSGFHRRFCKKEKLEIINRFNKIREKCIRKRRTDQTLEEIDKKIEKKLGVTTTSIRHWKKKFGKNDKKVTKFELEKEKRFALVHQFYAMKKMKPTMEINEFIKGAKISRTTFRYWRLEYARDLSKSRQTQLNKSDDEDSVQQSSEATSDGTDRLNDYQSDQWREDQSDDADQLYNEKTDLKAQADQSDDADQLNDQQTDQNGQREAHPSTIGDDDNAHQKQQQNKRPATYYDNNFWTWNRPKKRRPNRRK